MASPQQPYEDEGPDPEGGQMGQDGAYEQPQDVAAAPAAGSKKKRAYAGQAYEFGAGANSALGGQQAGGGQYPGSPPAAGGYGYPGPQPAQQQQQQQQPSYGMPQQPQYGDQSMQNQQAQPAYGQPQYGAQQGGYEPPQAGYQPPGHPQQQQQGMQGMNQQFQQMSVGGGPSQGQAAQQLRLNPLQPVDISIQGQPFHVTDLEQPPPPIILPPNVSNPFLEYQLQSNYLM